MCVCGSLGDGDGVGDGDGDGDGMINMFIFDNNNQRSFLASSMHSYEIYRFI